MVQNVTGIMIELEPKDFYLLSDVEQSMRFSEWVNREKLPKDSGLTAEEIDYHIDHCMTYELVECRTIQYVGYKLTAEGHDALAPRTPAQRDTIQGSGVSFGADKEGDVFEVQSFKPLALKFYREGYTNFRGVRRERSYASENHHVSWFYTACKAAEREYEALGTLFPGVSVSRPVDYNRHATIMVKFDSVELVKAKLESEQVTDVLDLILSEMVDAYTADYVHANMSEYNVAIGERGITVFNWSQAVPTDRDNTHEPLVCDARGIVDYFHRKYPGKMPGEVDINALSDTIAEGELESVDEFAV